MPDLAESLARAVRLLGVPWIVRATIARRRASVLLYHDPDPATVDAHLTYLRGRYSLVPLDDLVAAVRRGTFRGLPKRPLVITIDDGHRANHALLGVFRRHRVVPTIYLCSQIVGTGRHYWFLDTADPESLKRVPNSERLRTLADDGFDQGDEHPPGDRHALSVAEIADMSQHVTFGGHTRFHPILPMCDDAEAEAEITLCKREIEEMLGRSCLHFAYPNGDHSPRDVATVEKAGFLSGRTTAIGWVGPRSDPYRLRILGVNDDSSVTRLAADLTGVTSWLAHRWTGSLRLPRRSDA